MRRTMVEGPRRSTGPRGREDTTGAHTEPAGPSPDAAATRRKQVTHEKAIGGPSGGSDQRRRVGVELVHHVPGDPPLEARPPRSGATRDRRSRAPPSGPGPAFRSRCSSSARSPHPWFSWAP